MGAAECPSQAELETIAGPWEPVEGARAREVLDHVRACARCTVMVENLREENALLADAAEATRKAGEGETERVPGYGELRELHRGGQGVVYLAKQLSTRRQVAIKMLAAGRFATSRQRQRFEREAELAAQLRHPNIVTVFDSGVTGDGRAYLVMEHVPGPTLGEYAAGAWGSAGAGRASARRELLEVFERVCDGVANAHARGVVHRDLKPSNIIVDTSSARSEPRIVDFGLAKALGGEGRERATMSGEFAGTFAYAAPETLSGGVEAADTRSDVYSLGVILYELLCGAAPLSGEMPLQKFVERVTGADPAAPSERDGTVAGDLDVIVLRALARDPARRYQSVEALREDVSRFLRDEPIEARRDSALYQLRRRVRRHRLTLIAAGAAVVVLAALSGKMLSLYREAESSSELARLRAEEAERQRRQAEKLASIGLNLIGGGMEGDERRSSYTDITEMAALQAERELEDDPAARAKLYRTLAVRQARVRNRESAQDFMERALADGQRAWGPESREYIDLLLTKAYVQRLGRDRGGAVQTAQEALSISERVFGAGSAESARAMVRLADAGRDPVERLAMLKRAAEVVDSAPAGRVEADEVARTKTALASALLAVKEYPSAERAAREALAARAEESAVPSPRSFPVRQMLAEAVEGQGRLEEAAAMHRSLYEGRSAYRQGRQSSTVVRSRRSLAQVLTRLGRVEEALELWGRTEGRIAPEAALVVGGVLLAEPSGHVRAEPIVRDALGGRTDAELLAAPGEALMCVLAWCMLQRGDVEGARKLAVHAYEQRDRTRPDATRDGTMLTTLVRVLEAAGDETGAERYRGLLAARPGPSGNEGEMVEDE